MKDATTRPRLISIVVPCYQEARFISSCMDSVRSFTIPDSCEIEVLMVDGGSIDATRSLIGDVVAVDRRFHLLDNPRKTQSAGLNIGVIASNGDYILRLDAHSTYPADYLAQCLETAARSGADNVGGVAITRQGGAGYQAALTQALTTHWFGVGSSFRTGATEGPSDTVPYGFFPRATFARFGFFDERLARAQDYEFNRRIIAGGGSVWLNPRIVVHYSQQATVRGFLRKQFLLDAPYNAYMWYLAPYAFTPRHAVTAVFGFGLLVGLPLAIVSPFFSAVFVATLGLYAALAIGASVHQALRYHQPLHVFFLPFCFLAFHVAHGLGVLIALARIATGTQLVRRNDARWPDSLPLELSAASQTARPRLA